MLLKPENLKIRNEAILKKKLHMAKGSFVKIPTLFSAEIRLCLHK